MITENLNAEELDPKDTGSTPEMGTKDNDSSTDEDNDDDMEEDEDDDMDDDDDDTDDDTDYEILPSNDAGITADDNAATGKMHDQEGE